MWITPRADSIDTPQCGLSSRRMTTPSKGRQAPRGHPLPPTMRGERPWRPSAPRGPCRGWPGPPLNERWWQGWRGPSEAEARAIRRAIIGKTERPGPPALASPSRGTRADPCPASRSIRSTQFGASRWKYHAGVSGRRSGHDATATAGRARACPPSEEQHSESNGE